MTWIATPNGLNRFDGYHFKHFLGRKDGVDFRNIGRIAQDDEGWLWLLQGQEILFFHPQTERTQTVMERFGKDCILLNSQRPASNLDDFQVDDEGRMYFLIDETNLIYTYHSSEGFRKKIMPPIIPKKYKYFRSVSDDKELVLLLGNKKAVYPVDHGIDKFTLLPNSDSTYILKEQTLFLNKKNSKRKQKGERWTNDWNNYYFFDEHDNFLAAIEGYRKSNSDHVFIDQQNNYWISTKSGFYIVEIIKNKFNFIEKPSFYPQIDAHDMVVDSMKIILALQQKGLVTYDFKTKQWNTIQGSRWNRGLFAMDKGIWVSHIQEINLLQNGVIESFKYPVDFLKQDPIHFWSVFPSRLANNQLWLGSSKGLYRFDTQTNIFQPFKNKAIKELMRRCGTPPIGAMSDNQNCVWSAPGLKRACSTEARPPSARMCTISSSPTMSFPPRPSATSPGPTAIGAVVVVADGSSDSPLFSPSLL